MQFEVYKRLYMAETEQAFKQEMFKELGVVESPLTNEAYSMAWRLGHKGGPEEVYWMFFDIIDSIRS